jgi:hypothetical protein
MASTRVTGQASYGTVSIGGTAALLKAANTSRTSIVIQNVHATQLLYIGSDASVTTANGVRVAAVGGTLTLDDYTGPIYAIASGAATDVRYWETN